MSDAKETRSSLDGKPNFFRDYNRVIAPRLYALEQSFQVWANQLVYIHPPLGTLLRLNLSLGAARDYASEYAFSDSLVKGQVVAHLLKPKDDLSGRYIVLFRGTSPSPAYYRDKNYVARLEPDSVISDTDPLGIGFISWCVIAKDIKQWVERASMSGRDVTFVGHSLGGNLALRALCSNAEIEGDLLNRFKCSSPTREWSPHVYAFSPAGLDRWTTHAAKHTNACKKRDIIACWHESDLVPLTGVLPKMKGTEIYRSTKDAYRN